MPIRRLQTRIAIAFVTLVCVLQGAAFVVVSVTGDASTRRSLDHELTTGARFFDRLLAKDLAKLEEGARNLAGKPEFRAAIRAGDDGGIRASLVHQIEQGRSDVAMLIDVDHGIVVDTSTAAHRPFPYRDLLARANAAGIATTTAIVDGALYQIAVAPVPDTPTRTWLAMAFLLDDVDAKAFNELTGLQVSFYSRLPGMP